MMQPLARALAAADAAAAVETMAEDVTLHVAVHPEPFQGRPATAHFLGAVLDGPLYDIEIGETIEGPDSAVLMFSSQVAGYDGRAEGAAGRPHRGRRGRADLGADGVPAPACRPGGAG